MVSHVLPSLLAATLVVSAFPALFQYLTASYKLLQYESATKKAAKYSAEASHQLFKTRTTQGAALLTTLVSMGTSALLLYDLWTDVSGQDKTLYGHANWAVLNVATGALAQLYVGGFWKGAMKAPLPGMTGYNDAVRATESGLWWSRKLLSGWAMYMIYSLTFSPQSS